jgi:hypothetical protein
LQLSPRRPPFAASRSIFVCCIFPRPFCRPCAPCTRYRASALRSTEAHICMHMLGSQQEAV